MTSQLLEETQDHRVETFGKPVPVQINEALASRNSKESKLTCIIDKLFHSYKFYFLVCPFQSLVTAGEVLGWGVFI